MPDKATTHYRKHVERVCQTCGRAFQARADGAGLYCTRECWRDRAGYTPETRATALRESQERYRQAHAGELRERRRARQATPEEKARQKAKRQEYREQNRDRLNAAQRARNPKYAANRQTYRVANKARYAAFSKAWRERNPDRFAALCAKTVATTKHGLTEHFTGREWGALKAAWGYRCLRCWRHESQRKLTVDHIVPMDLGGSNTISNIQPLCGPCNSRKWQKAIDYRFQLMQLHNVPA
jgi:5-methylcytosine-specific restriction protein A